MAKAGEIVAKLRLDISDYQKNIEQSKKELMSFSDTTKTIAKGAGVAFGALATAMAGVAVASGKMALEQEKGLAKVQAQTALTDEQMKAFKKSADNLFLGGRGSYEEIYDSLSQVKTVLGETGEVAESSAEKALLLSEIFGYDISESLRAVDSANRAWGTTSEETFDLITALSQQAGDKADDLLDTFWEYAPVMAEAGFSAQEFGDILNSGMEAGAFNFDKIGDALKEFNVRLTDGSTQANGMAEELFGSASASEAFFDSISSGEITSADALGTITGLLADIEDPIKRNTLGVAFFGTMWEDLGAEAMLAMGQADGSLKNVEGSLDSAGQSLDDNILAKVELIRRQFIVWSKELGEQMLPAISQLVDFVSANLPAILDVATVVFSGVGNAILFVVEGLMALIGFLSDNSREIGIVAGIITAILLPALVGWATNMAIVNGLAKAKALVSLITNTLRTASANYALGVSYLAVHKGALLAMGVFGLLVGAGVLLWKNWDKITAKLEEFGITSESVNKFLVSLKDSVLNLWDSFKGSSVFKVVAGYVQGLINNFVGLYEGIKAVITSGDFTPLLEAVQKFFPMIIGMLLGGLPQLLIVGGKLLSSIADGMGLTVPELIAKITEIIVSVIEQFVSALPQVLETGMLLLISVAEGMLQGLPVLLDMVTSVIESVVETFVKVLPTFIDTGVKILTSLIKGIVSILPKLLNTAITLMSTVLDTLIGALPSILNAGVQILMAIVNGIVSVLPKLLSTALNLIAQLAKTIIGALPSIISAGVQILTSLVSGILQVLPSLLSTGMSLILQLGSTILSNVPMILSAGMQLISALVQGILSMAGSVMSAVGSIGSNIVSSMRSINLYSVGTNIVQGLWNGISGMGGWLHSRVTGFASSVMSSVKGFFGIHSPSRLFRDEIGVMLVRGLNIGIEKMKNLPVDSMLDIADNIVGTFDNLGDIDVAPTISGMAKQQVDVSKHVQVEGGSGSGTQYNAPIVQVENMHVKDESDVRAVSRELFNLQRSKDRSKGGK